MPITLLDGILVGFTLVSAMLAMVRGFSREVLSVVSWAAAAAAAFFFYKPVLPYIKPYVDNDKIAMAASAGAVFVIALIVVSVITMKLADWIIDSRIGALDRHWRNIKVIASHNPRLYKERLLGQNLLSGRLPPTGAFF